MRAAARLDVSDTETEGRRTLKTTNRAIRFGKGIAKSGLDIFSGGLAGALIGGIKGFASYDQEEDKDPYTAPFKTLGKITSSLEGMAKGAIVGGVVGGLTSATQGLFGMFVDDYEGMSLTGAFVRGFRAVKGSSAAKGIGSTAGEVREGMEEIPFVSHVFNKDASESLKRQVRIARVAEAGGDVEKANTIRQQIESQRSKILTTQSRERLSNSAGG